MAWSYSLEKEGDGPGMASFRFGAMTLLMPHFPESIYIQYVQVMSRLWIHGDGQLASSPTLIAPPQPFRLVPGFSQGNVIYTLSES